MFGWVFHAALLFVLLRHLRYFTDPVWSWVALLQPVEGTEFEVECDLIVSAIGQGGDLQGIEEMGNDRNLMNADKFFQHPDKPGHFVAGDIIQPHLLITAIGHASIAADSIERYLGGSEFDKRPKVDVHHINLLNKTRH